MLPFVFCDCTTPKGEKGVGTLMKRRNFNFLSLHEIETNLILHNVGQKRVCVNTCVVSNHVAVHTPNPRETPNLNPPFPPHHGSFFKNDCNICYRQNRYSDETITLSQFFRSGGSQNIRAYWLFGSGPRFLKGEGNLSLLALTSMNISR